MERGGEPGSGKKLFQGGRREHPSLFSRADLSAIDRSAKEKKRGTR